MKRKILLILLSLTYLYSMSSFAASAKQFITKRFESINTNPDYLNKVNEDYSYIKCDSLPGFQTSLYFNEQILTFRIEPEVVVLINAPSKEQFNPSKKVLLIIFALPNGNTTGQTIGRKLKPGDDWHFDIQHIGAQTRFLREKLKDENLVTVYLETDEKSWPAWRNKHADNAFLIKGIVDSLRNIFRHSGTRVVLSGHSGGGSFTLGFLNAYESIPEFIDRILFLDSDYAYNDSLKHGDKLSLWLSSDKKKYLSVIAYNDSVALLNGKHFVSPTGGTWYRSKLMKSYLEKSFPFTSEVNDEFRIYKALSGRVNFILKENPAQKIFHTVQVELNGFTHGILTGTPLENSDYTYFGQRAYEMYIQESPSDSL